MVAAAAAAADDDTFTFSNRGISTPINRIRWTPQPAFTPGSCHFVTSGAASLTFWQCTSTAKTASTGRNIRQLRSTVPKQDAPWAAHPVSSFSMEGPAHEIMDITFVDGSARMNTHQADATASISSVLVTAGSLGDVTVLRIETDIAETDAASANSGVKEVLSTWKPHYHTLPTTNHHTIPAACVGVTVQHMGGADPEVASIGDDGTLVFSKLDGLVSSRIHVNVDSVNMTGARWRSDHDVVVSTDAGHIKLIDRRVAHAHNISHSPSVTTLTSPAMTATPLHCIAIHPTQSTRVATGTSDGGIKVWDLRSMKEPEVKELRTGHARGDVWEVLFSPGDAKTLVSCGEDGSIW